MPDNVSIHQKYSAKTASPCPLVIESGEGVYVTDQQGKTYLDMASGISVVNFGHKHPQLLQTMMQQAEKIAIVPRLFHNEPLCHLLENSCKLANMDKGIPMNSGAEAVETAIKVARKWGYIRKKIPQDQAEIIFCDENFHGRTITTISVSSVTKYKENFGPLTPGFKTIPFNNIDALQQAMSNNTAAFIVEPIQGEAGVIIPDNGYLKACETICRRHNVMLIVDEIQSGMGRSGRFLASQYENMTPDGVLLGKALGGGLLPISLFLAKEHLMEVMQPGDHGSTFGGNPLAAAVANCALNLVKNTNILKNTCEMGDYFVSQLQNLQSPAIKEIRGKGLFVAIQLDETVTTATEVFQQLIKHGLLSINTRNNTIRLLPPLVVNREQIDEGISIIKTVLEQLP